MHECNLKTTLCYSNIKLWSGFVKVSCFVVLITEELEVFQMGRLLKFDKVVFILLSSHLMIVNNWVECLIDNNILKLKNKRYPQ